MDDLNKFLGTGHLTRDPSVSQTDRGKTVVSGNISSHRAWIISGGARREETVFLEFEAWGSTAEIMATLKKGDRILIEGKLKNDTWTSEAGTIVKPVVVVSFVQIYSRNPNNNNETKRDHAVI